MAAKKKTKATAASKSLVPYAKKTVKKRRVATRQQLMDSINKLFQSVYNAGFKDALYTERRGAIISTTLTEILHSHQYDEVVKNIDALLGKEVIDIIAEENEPSAVTATENIPVDRMSLDMIKSMVSQIPRL